jgi:hypothetical protein
VTAGTLASWDRGVRDYLDHCALNGALSLGGVPPYPAADVLAGFASWLVGRRNVTPKTVRLRVLGVARWAQGLEPLRGDPRVTANGRMAWLLYSTLRGIGREHARRKPLREALTTDKLNVFVLILAGAGRRLGLMPDEAVLFTALLTLGVYGLCRVSELTSPTTRTVGPNSPTLNDVRMFRGPTGAPTHFEFTIRGSKTDVFRRGVTTVVYATGTHGCPVAAMDRWLRASAGRPRSGPLFVRADGRHVTRDHVNRTIKQLASLAGFAPERYSTHSMRAGGATSLSILGYPAAVIQQMGRWTSDAYLVYIRVTDATRREAMQQMARLPPCSTASRAASARAANDVWQRLRLTL